jgi:hypothetical protein
MYEYTFRQTDRHTYFTYIHAYMHTNTHTVPTRQSRLNISKSVITIEILVLDPYYDFYVHMAMAMRVNK